MSTPTLGRSLATLAVALLSVSAGAEPLANISKVATGWYHTCALTTTGGVKCWGSGGNGRLGNDSSDGNHGNPVDVIGLGSGATSVSASGSHTCAVTAGGGAKC